MNKYFAATIYHLWIQRRRVSTSLLEMMLDLGLGEVLGSRIPYKTGFCVVSGECMFLFLVGLCVVVLA
jgi:uncharacterized membrane protein (Fun14 family)